MCCCCSGTGKQQQQIVRINTAQQPVGAGGGFETGIIGGSSCISIDEGDFVSGGVAVDVIFTSGLQISNRILTMTFFNSNKYLSFIETPVLFARSSRVTFF